VQADDDVEDDDASLENEMLAIESPTTTAAAAAAGASDAGDKDEQHRDNDKHRDTDDDHIIAQSPDNSPNSHGNNGQPQTHIHIITRSSTRGRIMCCTPSVRLSVRPRLRFSRNEKAVETSNLWAKWPEQE